MTPIVFAYKSAAVTVECCGPIERKPAGGVGRLFRRVDPSPILPTDRLYLSLFYDQLGKMVDKDSERLSPVFRTVGNFADLHARSLASSPVFSNTRLLARIDESLVRLLGPSGDRPMRHTLVANCCRALAWRFAIHADD